ncbi:NADH:ubiquinone reductase (Na(+)-transporting) subunit D [Helcococcus ovis]|uniref:NADH:ubiquinone reductase (Na(+)-transporting) subunit D n=1 Tax=Helcococcus ovis TaxID=72026 RepID=A0A4R9C1N6_9FIRM|nr:NADH:ubiquinone reductase (Na(+)-transporting) subunit D [Helcococcus ovis]TFF64140.1 NADH:ubiquinone reductase (Na(+)-transporting) subunit D [Helcococcus ovis]TFF66568.1 NADH:ubiquinone reductase (Na(+)-transporting) subunit D [Helcococcus ovis]
MNKYIKIFKDQLLYDNPVLVQIIGICSALAVTNSAKNSLIMGLALIFTTGLSSFVISIIKDIIPKHIRMVVQVFIISFFVIIVDIYLKAFMPDMSKTLGPYVGLIITNCIIMGRAESFAMANSPVASLIDGMSAGLGYTLVLLAVAVIRELLGFGTLFGFQILSKTATKWTLMIMPPGAFFVLPIIMWIMYNFINKDKKEVK